jgi:hypothetical protein
MYYYLESPNIPNPFDDIYSRKNPPKAPILRPLTDEEMENENIDTREEIEWGKQMSSRRNIFLQKLVSSLESDKKSKPVAPHFVPGFIYFRIPDGLHDRFFVMNRHSRAAGEWIVYWKETEEDRADEGGSGFYVLCTWRRSCADATTDNNNDEGAYAKR